MTVTRELAQVQHAADLDQEDGVAAQTAIWEQVQQVVAVT